MYLESLLAVVIFSLVPLAIKFTNATPITICLFRLFITVFALLYFWRKKINFKSFYFNQPNSKKLWLLGIIFFFHWITYAYGVKLGGPSIGVLGLSTYGIQLVLAGVIFLGQRITSKNIISLFFSFVGILLIVPAWNFKNQNAQGLILSLLSATLFACLPILHKKLSMHSAETRIFAQFFGAFIGFLLFFNLSEWHLEVTDWIALVFLGVFGTLIAHSLWVKISSMTSSMNTALVYYSISPLTILLSHYLLGETFTWWQLIGAIVIVLASFINIFSFKRQVLLK